MALFHVAHTGLLAAALLLVPRMGLIGYGVAELVTLASYALLHWLTARSIGSPAYARTLAIASGVAVALTWPWIGGWSAAGLAVVAIALRPWRDAVALQILTRHPDVQWVRHELEVVDRWRRPLGPRLPHIRGSGPLPPSPTAVAERVVVASTSAITFRRAAARSVFPLPVRTHLRFDADALIVAGLGSRFRGWQLAETLGFYRRHERQQYACEADLERMIERQIEVGTLIAESLGRAEPVTNYKHRAILAALRGRPRRAEVLRGLVASLRLVSRPMIMARQAAALLYAGTAPDLWLGKIRRFQGFQ